MMFFYVLKNHFRFISKRPHIGGSNQSELLADYIIDKWNSSGFDSVEKVRYDVLLSLPRKDKPTAVKLLSPNGSVLVDVQGLEKVGRRVSVFIRFERRRMRFICRISKTYISK